MKSKLIKSILSIVFGISLLSVFPVESYADNGSQSGGDALLTQQEISPDKKRMPSRNYLEVVYENGSLSLFSGCYEGSFSLSFVNLDSGEGYEVPAVSVGGSISIELPCGEYEVSAIGSDGLILVGFMQVFEYK